MAQPTSVSDDSVKLKICLAGEGAVGKTSLIRRFVEDVFDDRHIVTMGAKVTKKELRTNLPGSSTGVRAILTIWDIVGHGGFKDFVKASFFRGCQGILAVCDVTREITLARLDSWREAIQSTAGDIPAYVLANKVDLTNEMVLWEDDIETFVQGWKCPYLLTSAKTGRGVEQAFRGLTERMLDGQLRKAPVGTRPQVGPSREPG